MRGFAAIGLVNAKFPENIGHVMRAAGCYQAAMVAVSGARYRHTPIDTGKFHRHIPLVEVGNVMDAIPIGAVPVAVEITDAATSLVDFDHPEQAFYIFGPEDSSVPQSVLSQCQHIVSIPTSYCMNLAATVNVVLFDRLAKRMRAAQEAA